MTFEARLSRALHPRKVRHVSALRPQPERSPAYLRWIRSLKCVICEMYGYEQLSPTEAAHVGVRGLRQKCSDRETLPMCGELHHRLGKASHHVLGKLFFIFWGIDRDELIQAHNAAFDLLEAA